jgi:hypothetical protein
MKVIIAGSRTFNDYELLKRVCNETLTTITEIVSGTANGADKLGERYAKEKGYSIKQFPADWNKHGKSAGYIRNKQMAEYADALIAFWDGKSKGTKHMIDLAKYHKIKVKIINT